MVGSPFSVRRIQGQISNGTVTQICSQISFLFDVTAKKSLCITAISFIPGVQEGDFEIWWTATRHDKVHQTQKDWTLVGGGNHRSKLLQHHAQLHRHVWVPEGERHAFFIIGQSANAICFSTDTQAMNSAQNDDMLIHLGHFKSFPWESQLSTGPFGHNGMQAFMGSLDYQVLQASALDNAMGTVTELWRRRPFPDAQVVSADGKVFPVHRAVLASASHVIEAAWKAPLRENEERLMQIDSTSDCVESLLCFMYTGSEYGETDAGEMLRLAHLFSLPTLVLISAHRIAQDVTTANAVWSVRALRTYREDPSVSAAWQLLLSNIQSILAGNSQLLEEVLLSV
mmetsp:Transcript_9385/g.16630  ORF Transcript_9385/g.16630 Transcript_9385/m.16630 type:complete len:341 (+) Transcript_9385:23-1045(+)